MKYGDPLDPKGLMQDSYTIEGISDAQCRSIFLDWALSLPAGHDSRDAIEMYLERYGTQAPDHPMTAVLRQGMETMAKPKRRGGWRSRERDWT
ncbi:hypothetical protein QEZ52_13690 [Aliisedimentitalea scapharcae]|uniref:Uncharacterized protein n=1 Tax=Aliisedimentitalea scapharcae TaxID=1524259 RepID=A0ABZ2XPM7_9RHOB